MLNGRGPFDVATFRTPHILTGGVVDARVAWATKLKVEAVDILYGSREEQAGELRSRVRRHYEVLHTCIGESV